MQLKLYKRSTLLLTIVVLIDIISIVLLLTNRQLWANNKATTIFVFVLFIFILSLIYSHYDLNADKT